MNDYYATGEMSRHDTAAILTERAVRAIRECQTLMVIVDDVHFLNISAKDGQLANDYMKQLMNSVPATFVYTGIEIVGSGLFQEGGSSGRKTQTAGRFTAYEMSWFSIDTQDQAEEWMRVIAGFEDALRLYHHKPRSLTNKYWRYLHERTQGSIAALSSLLRESALDAIETGEEAVTVEVMNRQRTSLNHETPAQRKAARRTIEKARPRRKQAQ